MRRCSFFSEFSEILKEAVSQKTERDKKERVCVCERERERELLLTDDFVEFRNLIYIKDP